jgi:hypothetical protein
MPKFPDFSDLTKKFDLQGLMDNVKSAINQISQVTPKPAPEGDEIAAQFVTLIEKVQRIAKIQAEQAKEIAQVNLMLNELYRVVDVFRHPEPTAAPAQTARKPATPPGGDHPHVAPKAESIQKPRKPTNPKGSTGRSE